MSAGSTDPAPSATPPAARRPGARRAAPAARSRPPGLVRLGLGAFVALVAWVALVLVAIHYGRVARGGSRGDWALLAAAALVGVGCLFLALMLVTLALRRTGVIGERSSSPHRH